MKKALVFKSCEKSSVLKISVLIAGIEKSREFGETSLREFLKNRLKADDVTGGICLRVLEDMAACDQQFSLGGD